MIKRFFIGLIFTNFLFGNVQAELVGHWPMKATSPLKIVWDADDSDDNTWSTSYSATAGPSNLPIVTLPDGDKVWEVVGAKNFFSSSLIPIDPSKKYRLSGTFKGAGSISSKVYFGFVPLLDNGTNSSQTSQFSFRKGNDGIIQSWNDTSITVNDSLSDWSNESLSRTSRLMGFYYDGKTNRPPDWIMYSSTYGDTERGAYISAADKTITLSYPVPETITSKFIPGVSVVKNHYTGSGTYLYSTIVGSMLPTEWTTYSGISTGDGWTQTGRTNLRPFTRFVRIMFLLNYHQTVDSTVQFDKIILEEVQAEETATDGSFQVYDNAPFRGPAVESRHHGSNYGATYTEGPNGVEKTAMRFNGTSDYISLPNDIGYTDQVSAFSWFKQEGTPAGNYHVIFGGAELEISINSAGSLKTGITTDQRYTSISGSGLLDGNWHHIGFTYDGITKTSYIDGIAVNTQAISGTLVNSFSNRRMGEYGTANYFLNGSISDARIYNHTLSLNEIALLSKRKKTISDSSSITTVNANKTGTRFWLYWDKIKHWYWQGTNDGSLERITTPSNYFKTTAEISILRSGKTAINKQLYLDTDKNKYYLGQPDGGLRPLST